jgi:DNA adenine methylase
LVYADPPYLFSTRASKDRLYAYEFGAAEDHIRLLYILRALPCMVILSGYDSPLYRQVLSSWRVASFPAQTRSHRTAMEYVWMNYPEPVVLHDYRYLGENFREREKINRRKKRWKARLASMPNLERLATLAALQEFLDCDK